MPEPRRSPLVERLRELASLAVFGVAPLGLPALVAVYLINNASYANDGNFFDLNTMWSAGRNIVHGHSPYPFIYPAPAAVVMVPFGLLPWRAAVIAFFIVSLAAVFATLRILGVRDWRCYGACLASLPTASALWIGTPTPFLALAAACAWRWRNRWVPVAVALTAAVATKIFLWPLFIWLLATRRYRAAIAGLSTVAVATIGAWAVIGFSGLASYPKQLTDVASVYGVKGFSTLALLDRFGVGGLAAKIVFLTVAVAALAFVVLAARRPDGDAAAFAAAIAAALWCSPVVWVHYLLLLFIPIAIVRPRLSAPWLVPLALWPLAGQESNGSIARLLLVLGVELLWLTAVIGRPSDSTGRRWQLRFPALPPATRLGGRTAAP